MLIWRSVGRPTVFVAFLKQVLIPELRPGYVVVMGNLGAHLPEVVRQLLAGITRLLGAANTRRGWRGATVPAALLAGPQSDRDGMVEAKDLRPVDRPTIAPRAARRHRRGVAHPRGQGRQGLVPALRLDQRIARIRRDEMAHVAQPAGNPLSGFGERPDRILREMATLERLDGYKEPRT